MDNNITLYKAPWTYGDEQQPYFTSVVSRDNYFSTLESKQVNINNPNIQIDFNYEISLKIDIDITVAQNYNYAIVRYNGTDYYAFIVDMQHISVNRTRIELYRHALAEVVDYFSYFKNFNIYKATFKNFDFSRTRKITYPNFRYSNNYEELKFTGIVSVPDAQPVFSPESISGDVVFLPSIIMFCDIRANVNNVGFIHRVYGEDLKEGKPFKNYFYSGGRACQGSCLVFPLYNVYFENLSLPKFKKSRMIFKLWEIVGPSTSASYFNYEGITAIDMFIDNLSPYITSIQHNMVPFIIDREGYLVPMFVVGDVITTASELDNSICGYTVYADSYTGKNAIPQYVGRITSKINIEEFVNLELSIFSDENIISIPYDSIAPSTKISVIMEYIFDPSCSSIAISVIGLDNNSVSGNTLELSSNLNIVYNYFRDIIPFNDNTWFNIASDQKWLAENRYYDAMTKQAIKYRGIKGALNASENIAIGTSQIISSGSMKHGEGQKSMGIGNIIRGVFELGETANDASNIKASRELQKENDKLKPNEYHGASNALSGVLYNFGRVILNKKRPLYEDLENFKGDFHYKGIDCDLFRIAITTDLINELSYDTSFYMAAYAERSNKYIDTRKCNELLKYLINGCHYTVI